MAIRKLLGHVKRLVLVVGSKIEPRAKSRWWPLYQTAVNTLTAVLMAVLILSPLFGYPFLLELAFILKAPLSYVVYGFWWSLLVGGSAGAALVAYAREEVKESTPKRKTSD